MSYTLTTNPTNKSDLMVEVDRLASELPKGNADDERDDHLRAIGDALRALYPVVGRDEDQIKVSVSGHSNINHAPSDGWADEMITITVSVSPREHILTKDCWCNPDSEEVSSSEKV